MKIGQLARATGFKDKTIRYYERQGLVPDPGRTLSGYREYGPEDVDRLEFIRKAKRLGLSLEDIRGVLLIHDRREPTCRHVRSLLDEKLRQVDAMLKDLKALREQLLELREGASAVDDCRPVGGRICGIIEDSAFGANEQTMSKLQGRGVKVN